MKLDEKTIGIKAQACKKARERHPWIYSGAIFFVSSDCTDGDIVQIVDEKNSFIGYGFYNSKSKIIVRLFSFENKKIAPEQWIIESLENAFKKRDLLLKQRNGEGKTNAVRLVNSESDSIPGLIIDKYSDCFVIALLTAGIDRFRSIIVAILKKKFTPELIYEVNDTIRDKERLQKSSGVLYGKEKDGYHYFEYGIQYRFTAFDGQKTGSYLDQADNHFTIRKYVENKNVLDVFCYTGGFTLNALMGNASDVTSIDSSSFAMEQLRLNILANNPKWLGKWIPITGKAVETMKLLYKEDKNYDVIIIDPPKLAPHRRDVPGALRYYKEINMMAMKILNKNGIGICFSCSQVVSIETLCEVVRWASIDVDKKVVIIEILLQSSDHPYIATIPESLYLKGIVFKID